MSARLLRAWRWAVVGVSLWVVSLGYADSYRCSKDVDLYDPSDPSTITGTLSKGTAIELGSTVDAHGMVPLVYTTPDGDMRSAVCRAQDVGKRSASNSHQTKPKTSKTSKAKTVPKISLPLASKPPPAVDNGLSQGGGGNIQALVSNFLVNERGESVSSDQLARSRYVLVYYSAHWCPPCRAFTPKLVEFYNRYHDRGIEVIFVSSDSSEKDQFNYMKEAGMPFPALRFDAIQSSQIQQFAGRGIPSLVAFDQNGNIVSDTNVNGQYLGPQKVLKDVEALLAH